MAQAYNVIIEKDNEGWFVSEVVELPGCHTQAKSIDELIERTKEAIKAYLETNLEPEVSSQFIGIQQVEV
jgi:predicted RNase H-like HicB family nuclease